MIQGKANSNEIPVIKCTVGTWMNEFGSESYLVMTPMGAEV